MTQLIVALHGNPGTTHDFDAVIDLLTRERDVDVLVHRRPHEGAGLGELVAGLEAMLARHAGPEITVLAYSWGCYLACRWLSVSRFPIARLILVSPTVVAENRLSPLVVALARIPVAGWLLLKKIAPAKSREFIDKSYHPQRPPATESARHFQRLNHAGVWRGALRYKWQQQTLGTHDLHIPEGIETVVVRGELDSASCWPVQEAALRGLVSDWRKVAIHVVPRMGHALPWTAPSTLAGVVRRTRDAGGGSRAFGEPVRSPDNNVVSFLRQHALTSPQKIALRWVDPEAARALSGQVSARLATQDINFRDFYQRIARLAQGLADLGLRHGDRVILFLPMSLEMYLAMFAIQHLGAIAVFLDSWARRSQLGASARCVAPAAMISHRQAFELIAGVPELDTLRWRIVAGPPGDVAYAARLEDLLATPGEAPMAAVDPTETALITFTTGSSGEPKGANRTHRFLRAQHAALAQVVPYRDGDTDIPAFPIFSLNNLASGVTTLLPAIDLARPHEHDAAALVSQIVHEKISCTTLSPSMLNGLSGFCLRHDLKLPTLRRVITGGAPISRDNVSDFCHIAPKAEIWILYGSTEVEPMAHIEAQEMLVLERDRDPELVEEGVNVGHIAHGLRYKFIRPCRGDRDFAGLDWQEWELPPGEVGEFIVSGDHVCANYYNNETAFRKTKILDSDGRVWHRTGDLARLDARGHLWIVGRVHNMITRQGRNLYPVKAEIVLNRCGFVRQGAYLGLPDPRLGERAAVAVAFNHGFHDKQAAIRDVLRLAHKNQIIVDSLYEVDAIPMDPRHHSKVEYSLLREQIRAQNVPDLLKPQPVITEAAGHDLVHNAS
jgi:acyl-CoA synthetase (AMP-forming)/AMP-acid ligase II/pimeloyl-ACP methyl ester carboxylesterase